VSPGNVTVGAAIRQKRIGRRASLGVIGPALTRSVRNASAGCWRRWASARAAASARPARVASTAWRTADDGAEDERGGDGGRCSPS
jgi:hypothetical protein